MGGATRVRGNAIVNRLDAGEVVQSRWYADPAQGVSEQEVQAFRATRARSQVYGGSWHGKNPYVSSCGPRPRLRERCSRPWQRVDLTLQGGTMAVLTDSLPAITADRGPHARLSRDSGATIVWLEGEHDIATGWLVADTLARAIALDDADLIVDLSGVEFIGADTIGILIRTRAYLLARNRSLLLRAPARCARRVMDILEVWALFGRSVEEAELAIPDSQPT